MFDFLDKCTLLCGGPAASVPDPENEAELSLKELGKDDAADEETLLDPVDPMDVKNYLVAHLTKPMGILFEENHDDQYGGAFVAEINEGCSAAADGSICRGDQLVAIGEKRVSGMDFDEVMKLISDSVEMKFKLSLFRGPAESLYGPSGASVEWLDEFVAERGEEAALVEDSGSEASPDVEHVSSHHVVPDDVALAAAALNGDVVDETFFTACQTLLNAESHIEGADIAAKAEETSVAVEDNAVAADVDECKDVVDETSSTACQTLLNAESHDEGEDVAAKAGETSVAVENDVVAADAVECKDVDVETAVEDDVVAAEVDECKEVDDETFSTACQTLSDAESHVEKEDVAARAEESSVAVEDEVVAAEVDECKEVVDETSSTACQTLLDAESHVEKEDVAARAEESSVADEDDVVAAEVDECKEVVDETSSTACQTLLDAESHVEKEDVAARAEESSVADEDDVVAAEVDECKEVVDETSSTACQTLLDAESHDEKEDVEAKAEETSVAVEDEVVAAEAVECDAEDTTEDLVIDDEGDKDEVIERDSQVDNEADALATVEDNADSGEDGACDAISEAETPMLNNAVNKASKDWLDKYLANPENQIVSNREVDAVDMVDEPTADLEARCKKAVEVKEAALAADTSNGTKGILKESRYSPKGVDEIKTFESDPVSTEESIDDDSAVSSVWSEPDDYIGELEEVPMKRGSTLAALGAASTLAANMMLA